MAGIAGKSVGVVGGNDLRETLGLGRVRLMAAHAEHGRIEFGGRHRAGIVGVFGQRTVAGFAIYVRVLAISLLLEHVGMAGFAGFVAGEIDRPGCDFRERVAAIVSVFAETLRHQKASEDQKQEYAGSEHSCQPEKMSRISEGIHSALSAADRRS